MAKPTKLIVLAAFDKDDEGNLLQAFDPRQMDSEEKAKREARLLAEKHSGVVAWSRDADPDIGEYGPPIVLFQSGDIPELE
ncbi:hypothetical protein [Rhizobium sp. CC-YZS058]|uniref:hypothetical protein n=1 Tax=Rhizobium sp. CC-YZS058 TaxID=3042153 RepID=UPI002B05F36A|nr:hypothetical protein [Rhizobium sp. CC-YZS058]MEA3534287.1 hypothetical protein [Rhizobium sp. CC-YZS058]